MIKSPPFVLSSVEDSERVFQQTATLRCIFRFGEVSFKMEIEQNPSIGADCEKLKVWII